MVFSSPVDAGCWKAASFQGLPALRDVCRIGMAVGLSVFPPFWFASRPMHVKRQERGTKLEILYAGLVRANLHWLQCREVALNISLNQISQTVGLDLQ